MERGMYVAGKHADDMRSKDALTKLEVPSVLRLINQAIKQLERLLYGLGGESDAKAKFFDVIETITRATDLNRDIALGCIQLNQSAGNYAVRHCVDAATLCLVVMRAMRKSMEETTTLMAAALSMNIDMLRIQDQLQGKTEPISEKDAELIRNHPDGGAAILRQAGIDDEDWLAHVLRHHEKSDGGGYPLGRNVPEISQNTKILSHADRYCAAVSARKYRKALSHAAALRDVFMVDGKAADPMLAAFFIKELGTYPPGIFVRLENGEVGVVTARGAAPATPIVHALIGPRGAPLSFPIKRDTAKALYGIREPVTNEQAHLRFSLHQLWGDEAQV
jgi:HD-GYP domain-containing protein (c-di-GMP phosphodiesterase class II)